MFPPEVEARALALAFRRGWVREEAAQGKGLEACVASGWLSAEQRDRLLWDAMLEDASQEGHTLPASWTRGAWADAPPEPSALAMAQFGPYQGLELLGVGGQGRVYKAFDPRLQREVALKVLHGARLQHHLAEARAQAQVEHRNVCRVYEVGDVEGQPYIALQLIRGHALRPQPSDRRAMVALLRDAAEGIHAAHRQGLLHLDVKPSNLLVSEEAGISTVYVTDFGLASELLQAGDGPLGSPPYCAPEQIQRVLGPLDQRTDVYGLGATLYVVLTGQLPFASGSITDLLHHIQTQEPIPSAAHGVPLPRDLEAILMKAMAKQPSDRYASALAFADDLERWLKGMPIMARPSSWMGQAAKWARRNRLAAVSLLALLGVGMATGAWFVHEARQRRHTRALLQTFSEDMRTLELRLYAMRMLPPEDHRRIEADLRQRLKGIEGSLGEMGDLAPAGHYALGLGYRSLREFEPSARHFKAAWEAGFRTPDSAEATGLAYGILTTVLTQQAQSLSETERKKAEAEIQRTWGGPGRAILATYAGTPLQPPYSAAMEAFHRSDFDGMFTHLLEAVRRQPWQVGTWRFMLNMANAHPEVAARHGLAPDEQGDSMLVRRLEATAPGDAVSQDVLGEHWSRQAERASMTKATRHQCLLKAIAAFEKARLILPDQRYPFDRAIECCDHGMELEPSQGAFWKERRAQIITQALKEPELAEAIREASMSKAQ